MCDRRGRRTDHAAESDSPHAFFFFFFFLNTRLFLCHLVSPENKEQQNNKSLISPSLAEFRWCRFFFPHTSPRKNADGQFKTPQTVFEYDFS